MSKKYGILARLSRDEKKNKSINIKIQIDSCKNFIERMKDGELVKEPYIGLGRSAAIDEDQIEFKDLGDEVIPIIDFRKRPELKAAKEDAKNKIIDCLLIQKWDRISRNETFFGILKMVFKRYGCEIYCVEEPNDPRVVGILMVFAENEINQQRLRTDKLFSWKFKNGYMPNRSIFGYSTVEKMIEGNKIKVMVVNEKEAQIVRDCFIISMTEAVEKYGINPKTYYAIKKNKRIYEGFIRFKGEERKGVHEAILK